MPFDSEFDDVYKGFLHPVLNQSGFDVKRADDIESQQNILRDIVEQIDQSDLIVADLTGLNPNVFYELGLAHALRKPVLLITQSIEEVPFDLKSYRLLEYDTHFARIESAKGQLERYGIGFRDGSITFGSPVTDFYPDSDVQSAQRGAVSVSVQEIDGQGYLDHVININYHYTRIAESMAVVTDNLLDLTGHINVATADVARLSANVNSSTPVAMRRVCRRLAERFATFNGELGEANSTYATAIENTENSLETLAAFSLEESGVADQKIEEQVNFLEGTKASLDEAHGKAIEFAEVLGQLPNAERRLNQEVRRTRNEINTMAGHIEKIVASISRTITTYESARRGG